MNYLKMPSATSCAEAESITAQEGELKDKTLFFVTIAHCVSFLPPSTHPPLTHGEGGWCHYTDNNNETQQLISGRPRGAHEALTAPWILVWMWHNFNAPLYPPTI